MGELLITATSPGQGKEETILHCVKERHQLPWLHPWLREATHSLVSGKGAVPHSIAMLRHCALPPSVLGKALFDMVRHLAIHSRPLLCVTGRWGGGYAVALQ